MTVIARTTNSDDDSEGRLLRLVTERGGREWIIPMEVFGGSGEDGPRTKIVIALQLLILRVQLGNARLNPIG